MDTREDLNREEGTAMVRPVLLDGGWREAQRPKGTFRAVDPRHGEPFGDEFPVSSWEDIRTAIQAGRKAAEELPSIPPDGRAAFLHAYARLIQDNSTALVSQAARETGLPEEPRLRAVELPRTCDQLIQAARAAEDRSWCAAVIDSELNIRSCYEPLGGPVVIFGPNNFPLAFNAVSGGDFAAAVAAGNPVIAKAHPGYPVTTGMLAELARTALADTNLPPAAVQLLYHMHPDDGLKLVSHADIGATAFTGSRDSGLALKRAAEEAGRPIYLEMSGINPVVLLPGALEERGGDLAAELSRSCTLGAGQFCTNPGLVILLENSHGRDFLETLARSLEASPPGILVSRQVLEGWSAALHKLRDHGARVITGGGTTEGEGFAVQGTLLQVSGSDFLARPEALQTEAFGPSTLAVLAEDPDQLERVLSGLEGSLTGSIYSHSGHGDDRLYARIEPLLRARVGRLLNDKMPTGVAVTPAMHHGGPYPATGHAGFTSVGIPRSLVRFAALRCYDNVRQDRLPPELRDLNPNGRMWRSIHGHWTQGDVRRDPHT
jgi:alpha-ketoglutaric semialdehyde dehydrogenase